MSISERFSFRGYNLLTWLQKNKKTLKAILTIVLGVVGASFGNSVLLVGLFGGASALGTKFILDAVDYFLTENPK